MRKRNIAYKSLFVYARLGMKLTLLISIAILISSSLPGTSANTRMVLAAAPDRLGQTAAAPPTVRESAAQTAMARQGARAAKDRRTISAQQRRLAALGQKGNPELFAKAARSMRQRVAPKAITPQAFASVTGAVKLPDGTPAPEWQQVWLMSAADGTIVGFAFTDSAGLFTLSDVAPGDYYLVIVPGNDTSAGALSYYPFAVSGSNPIGLGDLTLPQATKTIMGMVTRAGAPVSNATVVAYSEDTWQYLRVVTTGLDGTFSLSVAGGYWAVGIWQDSGADWIVTTLPTEVFFDYGDTPETASLDFAVEPIDGYLKGQVVDPSGNPLTTADGTTNISASLDIEHSDGSFSFSFLDGNGAFSIPVTSGIYHPSVWLDQDAYPNFRTPRLDPVELMRGTVDLGQIRLLQLDATTTISGMVSDTNGQPVSDIPISAWQPESGQFLNAWTVNGTYQLLVTPGDWQVMPDLWYNDSYLLSQTSAEVTVTAGQTSTANFTLERVTRTITGTLIDQNSQARVSDIDAWAYLRRADSPNILSQAPVISGTFSLLAPDGDLRIGLYLDPDGDYSAVQQETPITQIIYLQHHDAFISGTLRDQNGAPLTGINGDVVASAVGDNPLTKRALIDPATGAYSLKVAAGEWLLSYQLETDQYQTGPDAPIYVIATSNATATVDLPLVNLDGQVVARVVDQKGTVQRDTWVWVDYGGREILAQTNSSGIATLYIPLDVTPIARAAGIDPQGRERPPVPVGTSVNCQKKNCQGNSKPKPTQPKPRQRPKSPSDSVSVSVIPDVTLELRAMNDTLAGRVLDPDNNPLAGAFVSAWSQDAQWVSGTTDDSGNFSLEVVQDSSIANTWQISASSIASDPAGSRLLYGQQSVSTAIGHPSETPITLTTDLRMDLVSGLPPLPGTYRFLNTEGWNLTLPDGTEIQIPANAVPSATGEISATSAISATNVITAVQVTVEPQLELPSTNLERLASYYGYTFNLSDQISGRTIEPLLNQNASITFHYTDGQLRSLGITSEDQLRAAQFTGDTWEIADGAVIDKSGKTVTVRTKSLANWALVAQQQTDIKFFLPWVSAGP